MKKLQEAVFEGLCKSVSSRLLSHGIAEDLVDFQLRYSEYWTLSLFVSCKAGKKRDLRKKVEEVLVEEIGIEKDRVTFYDRDEERNAYEWYFCHPNTPAEVLEMADRITDEMNEQEADDDYGMGIPMPNEVDKKSNVAHLVLKKVYYEQIEKGLKTREYRSLTQYYCDKFFGGGKEVERVRFQLGYSAPDGGRPPQMEFEVKGICLVSDRDGSEFPAKVGEHMTTYSDLPEGFVPASYVLLIGKRFY